MPTMKRLNVNLLYLDLDNFRTIHQKNETHAINTMITISPDRFWALLDSLLEDGYHATENILLLDLDGKYIVKEGNRRIAALKIIFGSVKNIDLTESIKMKINAVSEDWKKENESVPCSIYKSTEAQNVDKIIALTHAKGEKAGRDVWTAVARARYNRDQKGQPEPGLDLLEKYLKQGKNLSETQAERWSGDYLLSILVEAIQKLFPHLGFKSTAELVNAYPQKNKSIIDKMVYDVGMQDLDFKKIRDKQVFFASKYGVTPVVQATNPTAPSQQAQSTPVSSSAFSSPIAAGATISTSNAIQKKPPKAQTLNEPKAVYKKLRSLCPRGNGREKVVTLLNEIKRLKINVHPHAFCFLLRSMFEISGKAYCADFKSSGGPSACKKDGNEKALADLLRDITNHMTLNNSDKEKTKILHGAIAEIGKKEGLLSATSMNQLVHNLSFSISPNDICILFGNIFPLLEEMNK